MRFIDLRSRQTNESNYDFVVKLGCGPNFVRNRYGLFQQMIVEQGKDFWFRFWLTFCLQPKIREIEEFIQELPITPTSLSELLCNRFVQASTDAVITYCKNVVFEQPAPVGVTEIILSNGLFINECYQYVLINFACALGEVFYKWLRAKDVGNAGGEYWNTPEEYLSPCYTPGELEKFMVKFWGRKLVHLLATTPNQVTWVRKFLLTKPKSVTSTRKENLGYSSFYCLHAKGIRTRLKVWIYKVKKMNRAIVGSDEKKITLKDISNEEKNYNYKENNFPVNKKLSLNSTNRDGFVKLGRRARKAVSQSDADTQSRQSTHQRIKTCECAKKKEKNAYHSRKRKRQNRNKHSDALNNTSLIQLENRNANSTPFYFGATGETQIDNNHRLFAAYDPSSTESKSQQNRRRRNRTQAFTDMVEECLQLDKISNAGSASSKCCTCTNANCKSKVLANKSASSSTNGSKFTNTNCKSTNTGPTSANALLRVNKSTRTDKSKSHCTTSTSINATNKFDVSTSTITDKINASTSTIADKINRTDHQPDHNASRNSLKVGILKSCSAPSKNTISNINNNETKGLDRSTDTTDMTDVRLNRCDGIDNLHTITALGILFPSLSTKTCKNIVDKQAERNLLTSTNKKQEKKETKNNRISYEESTNTDVISISSPSVESLNRLLSCLSVSGATATNNNRKNKKFIIHVDRAMDKFSNTKTATSSTSISTKDASSKRGSKGSKCSKPLENNMSVKNSKCKPSKKSIGYTGKKKPRWYLDQAKTDIKSTNDRITGDNSENDKKSKKLINRLKSVNKISFGTSDDSIPPDLPNLVSVEQLSLCAPMSVESRLTGNPESSGPSSSVNQQSSVKPIKSSDLPSRIPKAVNFSTNSSGRKFPIKECAENAKNKKCGKSANESLSFRKRDRSRECSNCFITRGKMKKCQQCVEENWAMPRYYCGIACQTKHWFQEHENEHHVGHF